MHLMKLAFAVINDDDDSAYVNVPLGEIPLQFKNELDDGWTSELTPLDVQNSIESDKQMILKQEENYVLIQHDIKLKEGKDCWLNDVTFKFVLHVSTWIQSNQNATIKVPLIFNLGRVTEF